MTTFTLMQLDNDIDPSKMSFIRYRVVCDDAESKIKIKNVKVDLSALRDIIDWSSVKCSMDGCKVSIDGDKKLTLTLVKSVSYEERKDFTFMVDKIRVISGSRFSSPLDITFELLGPSGVLPDVQYVGSSIIINETKPVIDQFKLNPSIVRSMSRLSVSLKCTNVEDYDIMFRDGAFIQKDRLPPIVKKGTNTYGDCAGEIPRVKVYSDEDGMHSFFLRAKLGSVYASAKNVMSVKVVTDDNWHVVGIKESIPLKDKDGNDKINDKGDVEHYDVDYHIVDIVLNEFEGKMWGFVQGEGKNDPVHLWNSTDGINWFPYEIISDDKNVPPKRVVIPQHLVHCPALHFDKKLYFVFGSKVDNSNCTTTVEVLDYKRNAFLPPKTAPADYKARSLHSCVIFKGSIWIIGGADKWGNGLNDVLVFDGAAGWSRATPNFPARCCFGATVRVEDSGKETIWIGGGMSTYDGDVLSDIWAFDLPSSPGAWARVEKYVNDKWSPLQLTNSWLKASALTFLDTLPDNMSNIAVNVSEREKDGTTTELVVETRFILENGGRKKDGVNVNPYSLDEIASRSPAWTQVTRDTNNYALASIGFNGCIWMMAIVYKRQDHILTSELFYLCPPEKK